jgi:hypothetical protein
MALILFWPTRRASGCCRKFELRFGVASGPVFT